LKNPDHQRPKSQSLLGKREPEVYGSTSFEDYLEELKKTNFQQLKFINFQSNVEAN